MRYEIKQQSQKWVCSVNEISMSTARYSLALKSRKTMIGRSMYKEKPHMHSHGTHQ